MELIIIQMKKVTYLSFEAIKDKISCGIENIDNKV